MTNIKGWPLIALLTPYGFVKNDNCWDSENEGDDIRHDKRQNYARIIDEDYRRN